MHMYKTSEAISHQINIDPAEQDDDVLAEVLDLDCTISVDGVEQQLRTFRFEGDDLDTDDDDLDTDSDISSQFYEEMNVYPTSPMDRTSESIQPRLPATLDLDSSLSCLSLDGSNWTDETQREHPWGILPIMKRPLRRHQIQAAGMVWQAEDQRRGFLLCDPARMGNIVIALSLFSKDMIHSEGSAFKRTLILVASSEKAQLWIAVFLRSFPGLSSMVANQTQSENTGLCGINHEGKPIVLVSYAAFLRGHGPEIGFDVSGFDRIIVDEFHHFSDPQGTSAEWICAHLVSRKKGFVLGLSVTPVVQHPSDLFLPLVITGALQPPPTAGSYKERCTSQQLLEHRRAFTAWLNSGQARGVTADQKLQEFMAGVTVKGHAHYLSRSVPDGSGDGNLYTGRA